MNYGAFKAALDESVVVEVEPEVRPKPKVIEVREEIYREIPSQMVAGLIKKHHPDIKVTNTLVESYVADASTRKFTTDETTQDLRKLNPADTTLENHMEYSLDDGTRVVISEDTQKLLNKMFSAHQDIIDHMRLSRDNFMDVIHQLKD